MVGLSEDGWGQDEHDPKPAFIPTGDGDGVSSKVFAQQAARTPLSYLFYQAPASV